MLMHLVIEPRSFISMVYKSRWRADNMNLWLIAS